MSKDLSPAQSQTLTRIARLDALKRADDIVASANIRYETFRGSEIKEYDFQKKFVDAIISSKKKMATLELAMGSGKSVISALVALHGMRERVQDKIKHVIYLCHSRTSMGSIADGVVNKFHRVFLQKSGGRYGADVKGSFLQFSVGKVDTSSDVIFLTYYDFVQASNENPAAFARMMKNAWKIIVDEAHHAPDEAEETKVVYGKVLPLLAKHRAVSKTAAMTGTWMRTDGLVPMGKEKADWSFTVQDSVNEGLCPPIHGVQYIIEVNARYTESKAKVLSLVFKDKRVEAQYIKVICDAIADTYNLHKRSRPFAVFVARVDHAKAIAKRFGEITGLGDRGIRIMTGEVSNTERDRIAADIKSGDLAGYVTCNVGAEAIDIPPVEVIHLVRRTKSIGLNMQACGRAFRNYYPKKKYALIVDYAQSLQSLEGRFIGVHLDDLVSPCGGNVIRGLYNGMPVISQDGSIDESLFAGVTMREERQMVQAAQSTWWKRFEEARQFVMAGGKL